MCFDVKLPGTLADRRSVLRDALRVLLGDAAADRTYWAQTILKRLRGDQVAAGTVSRDGAAAPAEQEHPLLPDEEEEAGEDESARLPIGTIEVCSHGATLVTICAAPRSSNAGPCGACCGSQQERLRWVHACVPLEPCTDVSGHQWIQPHQGEPCGARITCGRRYRLWPRWRDLARDVWSVGEVRATTSLCGDSPPQVSGVCR